MEQGTRVHRLRVLDPAVAQARAKQQVSRWLETQTPARLGLPAEAIVVLRSVRAPWSALHPDSPADVLRQRLRHAIRPVTGAPLGTGCDAVWFADQAELLACLAHDTVQGHLGQRWWWQTWLGHRPTEEEALHAWLDAARQAPAAMVRLGTMGQGLAWARHLGTAGRLALLQALQRHHPLAQAASGWLPRALSDASPVGGHDDASPAVALPASGRPSSTAYERTGEPNNTTAWFAWRAHDGASALLTLCTLLHEAPHLALDERELAARLRAAEPRAMPLRPTPRMASTPQQDEPPTQPPHPRTLKDETTCSSIATLRRNETHPSPEPKHTAHVARSAPPTLTWATNDAVPIEPGLSNAEPDAVTSVASASTAQSARTRQPTRPPHTEAIGPRSFAQATDTAHGGVFFLVNVALTWELYGDFTRPRHALLSVSPWQFLHAAAFALLGRPFATDPLAGWLRAQAAFSRPRPAWALGDTPLALLPASEQHKLLADSAPTAPIQHRCAKGPRHARTNDELCAWWPLLRQRLSLALNLPEREAIATCLNLSARIERRGDRLDVSFSLHHLPLAIRLAGLDRDPGWVPASGCDLRFHFEA